MNYLAKEYATTKIYGIDKQEFLSKVSTDDLHNQTILSSLVPYPMSVVKIEIITSGGIATNHLFVARDDYMVFKLGRSQDCDISISQNTISREQCRFIYDEERWWVRDGTEQKESANGTW